MAPTSRPVRPRRGHGRIVAGVCAALAERFGISATLIRLVFIVFSFVGAGELAYLILWLAIPKEGGKRDLRR